MGSAGLHLLLRGPLPGLWATVSAVDALRTELTLIEAVLAAARVVCDEWRIRGDHQVDRELELQLAIAVNDLADWRDRDLLS